ncbi:MAG TPA: hypothetical protein VEY07_04295 [Thermoplasmata archaeon]|nr:hypothetical protein [Thermoplasmata archaeon]
MPTSQGSVLHQQALTVMGFFTGLTLTALVLILNAPESFHNSIGPLSGQAYFELITTYVAIVGAMSSVAMVAFLEVGGGLVNVFSFIDKLGTTLFLLSVFGFMGILPLLLVAFTHVGALVVFILEIVLLVAYFLGRRYATQGVEREGPSP